MDKNQNKNQNSKEQRQREALAKIEEKLAIARTALTEAEGIANEAGVEFTFKVAYGMGGTFYPNSPEAEPRWDDSTGWVSSSQNC